MTYSPLRRACVLAAALALASTAAFVPALTANAAPPDPGGDAKQADADADRRAATDALADVRSIFRVAPVAGARATLAGGGGNATMALRDLAQRADSLAEDDRAEAEAYLARPTDPGGDPLGGGDKVEYGVDEATPACTIDLCVHYVTSTQDAPSLTDTLGATGAAGANGIPDYVDSVLRVMTNVHDTYIDAGYREPLPDKTRGGDERIDIYLAEIGSLGLYGYCTTDQPNPTSGPLYFDRWAYCVLDDDYTGFPNTPVENVEVTAAHEYFHATQYAYDAFEDGWFLEATATWAEDEVYDSVDDNVQYLRTSPLTAQFIPLDSFVGSGTYAGFHYGTWSFIRFLTEKYGAEQGGMPRLVLDMMKKVDGSLGARDQYSWQAIESVLKAKKTSAAKQFLAYSVANRRPRETYEEGKANAYPTGPVAAKVTLSRQRSSTGVRKVTTDHLTSATLKFVPKNLKKKKTKLKVVLDMAPKKRGSMAAITVVPKGGTTKVYNVKLNKLGDGKRAVPFSSKKVKYVEATLVNSDASFTQCYRYATPFSCGGAIPTYDDQKQSIKASVK